LPFLFGTLPIPVYAIAEPQFSAQTSLIIRAVAVLLLIVRLVNLIRLVLSPLKQIHSFLSAFPERIRPDRASQNYSGGLNKFAASAYQALQLIHDQEAKLFAETSRGQALERSLRDVEERHETMLISSNDDLWDVAVKSDRIDFSIRRQDMFGYFGDCPHGFYLTRKRRVSGRTGFTCFSHWTGRENVNSCWYFFESNHHSLLFASIFCYLWF
jgi:hypothetical protein